MVILLLCLTGVFFFCRYLKLKSEESFRAVDVWCTTSNIFIDWRLRNPSVYIGLSDKGQRILGAYIVATDEFIRTHPYVDLNEHRAYLMELYDELPPKPFKRAPNSVLSYFYKNAVSFAYRVSSCFSFN